MTTQQKGGSSDRINNHTSFSDQEYLPIRSSNRLDLLKNVCDNLGVHNSNLAENILLKGVISCVRSKTPVHSRTIEKCCNWIIKLNNGDQELHSLLNSIHEGEVLNGQK